MGTKTQFMNKKTKYALNGLMIGGVTGILINAYKQWGEMKNDPLQLFDWERLLISGGKGALIGGVTGLIAGAITDEKYSNQRPINTNAYLMNVLSEIEIDKDTPTFKMCERKCEHLIKFLGSTFRDLMLKEPYLTGSVVKGTAIEGKSDFDIVLPFSRQSGSISDLFTSVHDSLKHDYNDASLKEIRKQSKSIGLIFELKGKRIKIDVIPFRHSDDSLSTTSGYLHVTSNGIFSNGSFTKTNIEQQLSLKFSAPQKNVIKILKQWRTNNDIPISSYMIQLLVHEAYNCNYGNIPSDLIGKLTMVIQFIHDNIHTIKLVGIENSNNVISNISISDKELIYKKAKHFLDEIEYHPNTIKELITSKIDSEL
jgi:hypothetical protein